MPRIHDSITSPDQSTGQIDPVDLRPFIIGYTQYALDILEPTQKRLKEIFGRWAYPAYWEKYAETDQGAVPSPMQRFATRIKGPESVLQKIHAHPERYDLSSPERGYKAMHDALGARIVVYFLSHLPLLDREIQQGSLFEVSTAKPPYAYLTEEIYNNLGLTMERRSKASGYASIHYVLRLRQPALDPDRNPWFELQLRTITEDAWAEVEHVLGYKPNQHTNGQVAKQFQIISNLLSAIDENFNLLQYQLSLRQEQAEYEDSDPLTAENLPGLLAELSVRCAQYELNGVLKTLTSRGIRTVADLRTVAGPENVARVQDACSRIFGHTIRGQNLIAALMAMYGRSGTSNQQAALLEWVELRKLWKDFKRAADLK